MARSKGCPTFFAVADQGSDFGQVLTDSVQKFLKELWAERRPWFKKLLKQLPSIPSLRFRHEDVEFPITFLVDEPILPKDMGSLFESVSKTARDQGTAFVVGLDEAQYPPDDSLAAWVNAVTGCQEIDLPILGVVSGLPSVQNKILRARTNVERGFIHQELKMLSEPEVRRALKGPAEEAGGRIEDPVFPKVHKLSHGYPYFVQVWGDRLWDKSDKKRIGLKEVAEAAPEVNDYLDSDFYAGRWRRLEEQEKRYVRALAHEKTEPADPRQVASVLGIGLDEERRLAEDLVGRGILFESVDNLKRQISLPSFRSYVLRTQLGPDPKWKDLLDRSLASLAFKTRNLSMTGRLSHYLSVGFSEDLCPQTREQIEQALHPKQVRFWRKELGESAVRIHGLPESDREAEWERSGLNPDLFPLDDDDIAALCEAAGLPKPESNDIR